MRFLKTMPTVFILVAFLTVPVVAQQTSGSISGVVEDPQGALVSGAKVVITNQLQGSSREMATSADGTFVFTPLQPAVYTLTVEVAGFKQFEQKDITLHADDRLALPAVVLAVGQVTERVTVEASAEQLQTQSAERAGVITGAQTLDIAINGRSWTLLMKTVPGVVADVNSINGQRVDQNNGTYDGVTAVDAGSNSLAVVTTNVDAVAEMKILTTSYQAEFGKGAGGSINIVIKSGTQDFHGTGYWFHRNEDLNADNWLNNAQKVQRPLYRYNEQGFNIGGPAYIPGKVNRDKTRFFFFVAQDWLLELLPESLKTITVPTAAQRQGDFSQTRDAGGNPITIKDPLSGAPFPGNIIPQSRFSPFGQPILNFYPMPNVSGQASFNYGSQISQVARPYEGIYRFDYNISSKWRAYARYTANHRTSWEAYCDNFGNQCANNLGLGMWNTTKPSHAYVGNLTTIISPTFTNEFILGSSVAHPQSTPIGNAYSRSAAGITFTELYPNADPLQLVPNFSYSGVPSPPSTSFAGLPYSNTPDSHDFTDNLAKVFLHHTVKAGVFVLINTKSQVSNSYVVPQISFAIDSANAGDTNWPYSNALLGNFDTYIQNQSFPMGHYRFNNVEWYAQDNWKVSRNLTLDYGMRFYVSPPWYEENNLVSSFNPTLYNAAQGVVLYRPALNASGAKVAVNPLTGASASSVLVGAIVPGVGNVNDGIGVGGVNGYPKGLTKNQGVHYAPRIGLAWSLGQSNRTVVRAGAGVFYDEMEGNPIFNALGNPPNFQNAELFYGNVGTIAGAQLGLFPPALNGGMATDGHVASTYNWNLTFQRELPLKVMFDAAYVGSVARHLLVKTALNEPAFGSAWLPQNQDPTLAKNAPNLNGSQALATNFLRPYQGYGNIYVDTFGGSSNFNSLQISATRRVTQAQFGITYTWSKALGTTSDINTVANPLNTRKADYGWLTFDRTQSMVANFMYSLPRVARGSFLDNRAGHLVLNGWEVSGIVTMNSGAPVNVSYSVSGVGSTTLNEEITGDPTWAPRIVVTGNPNLSPGDRTISRFINTSVFLPATRGSTGMDSGNNFIRGPGINDWDVSVFKNIPYWKGERRYLQLRVEMYNAFNHTQFSAFNSSITFNAAGQITNLPTAFGGGGGTYGFGAMTTARTARVIQLAAKFYF